jgi:hypothetical protein
MRLASVAKPDFQTGANWGRVFIIHYSAADVANGLLPGILASAGRMTHSATSWHLPAVGQMIERIRIFNSRESGHPPMVPSQRPPSTSTTNYKDVPQVPPASTTARQAANQREEAIQGDVGTIRPAAESVASHPVTRPGGSPQAVHGRKSLSDRP